MSREGLTIEDLKDIDLFDVNRALLIDSMAGAGKTSTTDAWISSQLNEGEKYLRESSTHLLTNEVREKYGHHCDCTTIASGSYDCSGGIFYALGREKDVPDKYRVLVLDEVPQTHENVYKYAESQIGKVKVIITCDSHQQLGQDTADRILEEHERFCNLPNVDVIKVSGSWRPVEPNRERTLDMYDMLRDAVEENEVFTGDDLSYLFKTMTYDELKRRINNGEDVKISCHTNDIEDGLIKDLDLESRVQSNDDLIFKGGYRGKAPKKASTRVAVLSQKKVNRAKESGSNAAQSYAQLKCIGTPTRFEGCEIDQGHPFIYAVNWDSRISARELYTDFTRVRDIEDYYVVYVGRYDTEYGKKTFNGLPIKKERTLKVDFEKVLAENFSDRLLKQAKHDKAKWGYYRPQEIGLQKMRQIIKMYGKALNENEVYQARFIRDLSGDLIFYSDLNDTELTSEEMKLINDKKGKSPITARSVISKDAKYDYTYMGKVFEILDSKGIHELNVSRVHELCNDSHKMTEFYVDIWSCHTHILKFCEMPIDGKITTVYDENMMNFYLCDGCDFINKDSVIEDKFAKYLKDNNICDVHYLFSVPKDIGSNMADRLYKMAHKDIESKKAINEYVHWGYYEKQYIECDGSTSAYAVKHEAYNHQLLIAAIYSQIYYYMFMLRDALKGDGIVTDACYFNELTDKTIDTIKDILPKGVDWRIRQQYYDSDGEWIRTEVNGKLERYTTVVYQTCKDLQHRNTAKSNARRDNMTEDEKKSYREADAQRKRDKRANMSEAERQIARDRDKERKRKARANKRVEVAKKGDK